MPSQIKPTCSIFILHNLQGHSSAYLILDLNIDQGVTFLSSLGKIFQILAPKAVIVSVPYFKESTMLLLRLSAFQKCYIKYLSLKSSSMITEFKLFFVLNHSSSYYLVFQGPSTSCLTLNLPVKVGGHWCCECEDIRFFVRHVTTLSKGHMTWSVGSPSP